MRAGLVGLVFFFAAFSGAASAGPEADFFKSHEITVYIGYAPGGGYDLQCRIFAAHLGKHLPGNPTVIAKNQPGAGSLRLANELYNILPKDGTALGMIGEALVLQQVLGAPEARFDAAKFDWIGRIAESGSVLVVRPDAPIANIEDARTHETTIGVPGAGSVNALTLNVLDHVLGTKFKLISGYEGSAQIHLAVERGEVQGSGSTPWPFDKQWVVKQKLRPIYQATLEPTLDPDLAGVPTVLQLARSDDDRALFRFFWLYTVIGRSIVAPPGVPAERLAVLRAAFDATVADPAFIADANKANIELAVLDGEKLAALIRDAVSLKGPLLAEAKRVAAPASNP
ncbi:MAG TPA: tripartite tricarboxylate transporter substrate-binding protein [Stellaceae bacterium]|nr:tripartite tricarboxylate transporter substrate-binding protein [Stellaceae bacterium]